MFYYSMHVKNTLTEYGIISKLLHWLSAILLLIQIPLGFYLVDLDFVDDIIQIKSKDAIEKAKQLCKNGYYVGISAAANCLVAEHYLKTNPNDVIVTFLCDRGDRYMSMFNKN